MYPDKEDNIFNHDFFYKTKNCLPDLLDGFENFNNVVKVIKVSDFKSDHSLSVFMDGENNEAIAFAQKINYHTNYKNI